MAAASQAPTAEPAGAQGTAAGWGVNRRDARIIQRLTEKTHGAVMLDLDIKPNTGICPYADAIASRKVGGKWFHSTIRGPIRTFLGQHTFGAVDPLLPGDYILTSVVCHNAGHGKRTQVNGPFAKFQVNPGELVNLGTLKINYTVEGFIIKAGTLQKAIEPLGPKTIAYLKETYPQSFPVAVTRHMTLLGPSEVGIQTR